MTERTVRPKTVVMISANTAIAQRFAPLADALNQFGLRYRSITPDDIEDITVESCQAMIFIDSGKDESLEQLIVLRRRAGGRSIPIFAVASEVAKERYSRLLTAGATVSLEPDVGSERIQAEIQALTQIGDDAGLTLRNQLLQPYVAAALEAWLLMARSQAALTTVRNKREYRMYGDVSSLVYLMGAGERILALSLRNDVAAKLAVRVLNGVVDNPEPDMIQDVVGEMVNIIAGQVKGRFDDTPYHFDISTVTVVTGSPHHLVHRSDLPSYEMCFDSEVGDFAMQLCVKPPERLIEGMGQH